MIIFQPYASKYTLHSVFYPYTLHLHVFVRFAGDNSINMEISHYALVH